MKLHLQENKVFEDRYKGAFWATMAAETKLPPDQERWSKSEFTAHCRISNAGHRKLVTV